MKRWLVAMGIIALLSGTIIKMKHKKSTLVIGFGGDAMLGRMVNRVLTQKPPEYVWGNTLPLLGQTDFNIVNLETTLTESEQAAQKVFNFKSDPKNVACLKRAHIAAVNLANNHMLDYGIEGLQETINVLDMAGIKHVGAGMNVQEAMAPVIIEKNTVKVGLLGYANHHKEWAASQERPGINYIKIGDIKKIKQAVDSLRDEVDIIIILMHWGPNMRERPTQAFIDFAHEIINAGVDIIHGTSAHIIHPIEVYNNKLIMYDTGDFVDDYKVDPVLRNDQALFYEVYAAKENEKTRIEKLQLTPLLISNMQVNLATGKEKQQLTERIKNLSAEFDTHITDNTIVIHKPRG